MSKRKRSPDTPRSIEGDLLPAAFRQWFANRGWRPRNHQLELLAAAGRRRSSLLIAPTGAGKTLAGFLPSLVGLSASVGETRPGTSGRPSLRPAAEAIHTLYISPLKALAVDVQRNLMAPVAEMTLPIRIETRTGDTPASRRQRQRTAPPHILLTTPEQLALMLSHDHAEHMFRGLHSIVLDELHSLVVSKRGDLLSLDLARLRKLAPEAVTVGLSATVSRPSELRAYIVPQAPADGLMHLSELIVTGGAAPAEVTILETELDLPWSGHSALYALAEIYAAILRHRLAILFVNTRMQAELIFQALWRVNEASLPIAIHHGSLDVGQRRKVEAAMAAGTLRAVVATSTLDLGIDWGNVDLVVHIGAPKGASRLAQRIGRANHRLDEPSRAILVPANRFEVMECRAALEAAAEGAQDTPPLRVGALDVLAQHIWGMACSGCFHPDELYAEVTSAAPYFELDRPRFDRVLDFVATGGYALRSYERFARLKPMTDGRMRLTHPRFAQQYRLNVGTIIDAPMLKVRMLGRRGLPPPKPDGRPPARMGGRYLGEIEEYFLEQLSPGDTFVFAGHVLRFEGIRETEAFVTRAPDMDAKVPSYEGGKFPLSTYLAERVRRMLADRRKWPGLPEPVAQWLGLQAVHSVIPRADEMLVETFPIGARHYMVCYPFEGRLVHQTLGMLLTRRLDRLRARPTGFVASEYALSIWGFGDMTAMIADGRLDLARLFEEDMLGDDLDAWLAGSVLMKRTFRNCAVIAGLIERRHPGKEKTGRQVTVSTDLIYDVLRQHEPGHILLEAAWNDAATGLLDITRLGDFLERIQGRIRHKGLSRVSPLAVPVLLEIGTEPIQGGRGDELLREAAAEVMREADGMSASIRSQDIRKSQEAR